MQSKTKVSKSKSKKPTKGGFRTPGKIGYAPVSMSRGLGTNMPKILSTKNTTHIEHSEFFATVGSINTGFNVNGYVCNPGIASIFPWLSAIANRYETYKFRDLYFKFHTRCSTAMVGTVGMTFDFDARDDAPTSQLNALAGTDKAADAPWKEIVFRPDLRAGDKQPSRYVRPGMSSAITLGDLKTYDVGNLFVFTDGVVSTENIGLLEVVYSIDLFTPQIQAGIGGEFLSGGSTNPTALFGNIPAQDNQCVLPGEFKTSNRFVFDQAFEGLWVVVITGTGLTPGSIDPGLVGNGFDYHKQFELTNVPTNTLQIVAFAIRAGPQVEFAPFLTATTVTGTQWTVCTASYDSLVTP